MDELSRTPRVVFGVGAEASASDLLREVGARRVLLVAPARHREGAERLRGPLGELVVGDYWTETPQVPGEVADQAASRARALGVDWVLAHGGGTPIGVAKAVALQTGAKIAAIPTTYAGSERTDIWGITRDGAKQTGRDPGVLPALVVYDPALTYDLPRELSLQSLLNALAHAIEALYAVEAPDSARAAARASLSPLVAGIRAVGHDPHDPAGRALALRGAAFAAAALGEAPMGLHHKICHVLGGTFDTPHAPTHATLLPYTLGFNLPAAPATADALFHAWNTRDAPAFLYDLSRSLGLSTSARALGIGEAQLDAVADAVLSARYPNPRPVTREDLMTLLSDALHDRRPSLRNRRLPPPEAASGPHAALDVAVLGAPLDEARAVVLALHGRGASAERLAADLARRIGPRPGLAIVAPQAHDNTWYPKGFLAPPAQNQPELDSALSMVDALYADLAARYGPDRVVPVGFSQGACLLLTWLSTTAHRPARALAFTGAPTPLPTATWAAAAGARVHLGISVRDPWITQEVFHEAASRLRAAGAEVRVALVEGDAHTIHPPDEAALREAVDAALAGDELRYLAGLGVHSSEALPGALPTGQNSPRNVPYGLYAEQVNGTGFTVARAQNRRTWLYRLRPQNLPASFAPRPHPRFTGDFAQGVPLPEVLGFRPASLPETPTDFLEGLVTFAGAGDPAQLRGAAIHLFTTNRPMGRTALCNVDGELLLVPQLGRLRVRTEVGWMHLAPGEIAVLPRGLRFQVDPVGPVARGFLAEVFDGGLRLPERGPVGANGLADARHLLSPVAAFEDDAQPWTVVVKHGGHLWQIDAPHGPFDVVAWHGDHLPYKYDLAKFNSLGSVSFDHPDPSILTVLTCPADTSGRNALDFGVFRGRWDISQGTFRPAYFHRNAAVEFNAVVWAPPGSRFEPGHILWTPTLTPHGVSASTYRQQTGQTDAEADRPQRIPDDSLWIQFESTYLLKVMPWMLDHPSRDRDHLASYAGYPPPWPT